MFGKSVGPGSKGMELVIDTYGNERQKEAAMYWYDNTTEDIVYGGSKGCFDGETKVKTIDGHKEIKNILPGDLVLTINESTKELVFKPVVAPKRFRSGGTSEYHKMITFVMKGGNKVSMTCNHEIYIGSDWVPAGELARRILDVHSGLGWEVHDFEQGASSELWTTSSEFFKTYKKPEGLYGAGSSNKRREKVGVSSPISCHIFHSKSIRKAIGESLGLRQAEQLRNEFGVGDRRGECELFEREMSATVSSEKRRELESNTYGSGCSGDTEEIQKENCDEGYACCGIWCETMHDKGCNSAAQLDPYLIKEIRFELVQGFVYDLHVLDNHNYCVTEENLIVHNSGKSYLGCSLIFADAFSYPGTHYFIARKTLADLTKHTTTSIQEVFTHWGITPDMYKFNGQHNYYTLYNDSKVYLFDAKYMPADPQYSRLGSIQMTRGWIEEAGEFEEEAKNSLNACIGRWKNDEYDLIGKLLQTCNPEKNYLYDDYYKPFKKGTLSAEKKFVQALPQDNKRQQKGYIEGLYRKLNKNQRKRLLEGNWEYDDDPATLIDYEKILEIRSPYNRLNAKKGHRYVSADIARLGGDRVVIIKWDGFYGKVTSYKRAKLDYTTDRINDARLAIGASKSDVIIDADGIGAGVGDFGGFKHFHNNSRPLPDPKAPRDAKGKIIVENYDNLKSQCGFRMAELINENGIYLECSDEEWELIEQELEQVKQKDLDNEMKKGLVPKDEVKKLIKRSPDFWDAILMRMFFELKGKGLRIRHRTGNDVKPYESGRPRRRLRYT